jgi:hypothetical protein
MRCEMKMYLLYEWTEERESKMHIGIYSTMEKAQAAAEMNYREEGDHDDLPEGDYHELKWEKSRESVDGYKHGSYEKDYPYSIEEFEVDTYVVYDFSGTSYDVKTRRFTEPKKTVHQL